MGTMARRNTQNGQKCCDTHSPFKSTIHKGYDRPYARTTTWIACRRISVPCVLNLPPLFRELDEQLLLHNALRDNWGSPMSDHAIAELVMNRCPATSVSLALGGPGGQVCDPPLALCHIFRIITGGGEHPPHFTVLGMQDADSHTLGPLKRRKMRIHTHLDVFSVEDGFKLPCTLLCTLVHPKIWNNTQSDAAREAWSLCPGSAGGSPPRGATC